MDRPEWRWWEEFERTGPTRAERNARILRWVVTAGWAVLALFKLMAGAWLFALAYAVAGVGFFVAYGVGVRRHRNRHEADG